MPFLCYADNNYFLSGQFESDLKESPILIDPKWKGTSLGKKLESIGSLPKTEPGRFYLATSGSTGNPKLVTKDITKIKKELEVWRELPEVIDLFHTPQVQVQVPLCHLYGLIWGFFLPRLFGKKTVFGLSFPSDPDTIGRENGLLPYTAITTAEALRSRFRTGLPLPEIAIVSGMKFPAELAKTLREKTRTQVFEIYGSTETGGIGFRDPLRRARFQILPIVDIRTRELPEENKDAGHEVELLVKSPYNSQQTFTFTQFGEWQEEKIESDGFFETNDIGTQNEMGWYLLGRKDRIIKRKGKRVSLDTIEGEISELVSGFDFVCVGLETNSGQSFGLVTNFKDQKKLQILMQENLPDSHIPEWIQILESLPKLPNGKWDRVEMKLLFQSEIRIKNHIESLELNSAKEELLFQAEDPIQKIVQIVLKQETKVDETAHLIYDYQMDSLQFVEMVFLLERFVGKQFPEEDRSLSYFYSVSGIREYLQERIYLQ